MVVRLEIEPNKKVVDPLVPLNDQKNEAEDLIPKNQTGEAEDLIPKNQTGQAENSESTEDKRKVDFVLVYNQTTENNNKKQQETATTPTIPDFEQIRKIFEKNIINEGLSILSTTKIKDSPTSFVKIHIPDKILFKYAEIKKIKIQMIEPNKKVVDPLVPLNDQKNQAENSESTSCSRALERIRSVFKSITNALKKPEHITENNGSNPKKNESLMAEFRTDRKHLFEKEEELLFLDSVRINITHYILERVSFANNYDHNKSQDTTENKTSKFDVGIGKLVSDKVYDAAYPLHDDFKENLEKFEKSDRKKLLKEWADIKHWIYYQPKNEIKDYFGAKIALYFTWLGFYTNMLISASVVGLFCFLCGLISLSSNQLSNDVCDHTLNITMCPTCAKCDYWKLEKSCTKAKITALFDNDFTIFFTVFMSVWSTLYLSLWKRYSAKIIHEWGLTDFDHYSEHPRPRYLTKFGNCPITKNPVTDRNEPKVSFWIKVLPFRVISFSMVMFMVVIASASIFSVILFRMSQMTTDSLLGGSKYSTVILSCSTALIDLLLISLLNILYDKLAVRLTEMENLRTQTEFDDSLSIKIYFLQFVNYYSSIFYIAFVKGRLLGSPKSYNTIFGIRLEQCDPGGCYAELFIQLAIIMVGKQTLTTFLQILRPKIKLLWKKNIRENCENYKRCDKTTKQCIDDYNLLEWDSRGLINEYLEMIIQYGFVTLFVSAFPLAPVFALINNIFESRLDGKKFLENYQRPVPHRDSNIGVWYSILDVLGRLSVIINAFMIAFSSNFIPRLVYKYTVSTDHSEAGFLNHSLAYFNISHSTNITPTSIYKNLTMCRYSDYRYPSGYHLGENLEYQRPLIYWRIMLARLAFIVLYQNVITIVKVIVEWILPAVPQKLKDQIRRETYKTEDILINEGKKNT